MELKSPEAAALESFWRPSDDNESENDGDGDRLG